MERASLRGVPLRPQDPAAPADALSYVTGELPGLDSPATAAFALVALVGRPRPELAGSPDAGAAANLAPDELAEALARARKALRRKLHPLPGSGWCERAERLISDRIDGALADPGPARLDVHLANCDRCVEHERRLGQAQDALVAGFEKAHPPDQPESEAPLAEPDSELPPALRVVDTPTPLPPPSEPEALPSPGGPAGELPPPDAEPAPVEPAAEVIEAPAPPAPAPAPTPTPAAPPAAATPPAPPALSTPPASPVPPSPAPPAVAPPATLPARPAWIAPGPAAPAPPAPAPVPPPPPPAPYWPSTPRSYEAAGWHSPATWETRASRAAIEDDEWASLGPLLAVLFAAIAVSAIAMLLAL